MVKIVRNISRIEQALVPIISKESKKDTVGEKMSEKDERRRLEEERGQKRK